MMEAIFQAQKLNNEGVEAMKRGDEAVAVTSLAKAIKLLKQNVASSSTPTNNSNPASDDDDENDTKKTSSCLSQAQHYTVALPEMGDEQQSFIFNEAIIVSTPSPYDDEDEEVSEEHVHVYTGIVIFNLALAHHRKAKSSQITTGRCGCLTKADKLYGMALKILGHDFSNTISVLVKLASINNMAVIRFEMGDSERAKSGLQHLSKMLQQCSDLTPNMSCATDSPMFQEPQIKGLLMNVLLLRAPRVAPAA